MERLKIFFSEKRNVVICALIFFFVISPLCVSIPKWNKHQLKLSCVKISGKCNLIEYSYEHRVCWDYWLTGRLGRRRSYSRRSCEIPRYISSKKEIVNLNKISEVSVINEGEYSILKLKDTKGTMTEITRYKNYDRALFVQKKVNAELKSWQTPSESFFWSDEGNYEYSFPED